MRIEFYELKKNERKIQPVRGCKNQCLRPFVTKMLQPGAAGLNLKFEKNMKLFFGLKCLDKD